MLPKYSETFCIWILANMNSVADKNRGPWEKGLRQIYKQKMVGEKDYHFL